MTEAQLMDMMMGVVAKTRRGNKPAGEQPPHAHPPKHGMVRIMQYLLEQDLSPTELTQLVGIRLQSLSESVQKLESNGYVEKLPHPDDKRKVMLHLTEEGRQEVAHRSTDRNQYLSEFFKPLTPEERQQLAQILGKLLENQEKS